MKATKIIPILICCLGITAFILYQLDIFTEKEKSGGNKKNIIEEYNDKKEETEKVIETEKKAISGETVNQDQIVEMILDSSLNFDNVKGEYVLMESAMNLPTEIKYAVDMIGLKSFYSYKSDDVEYRSFAYGETKKTIMFDEKKRTYRIPKWVPPNKEDVKSFSTLDRLYKGLSVDSRAENIVYGDVINSHFVQSLKYYTDWEFEEIMFLDMPSYLIQGIDSNYTDGDKFKMVVEKNTGIVLDYHLFDIENKEMISVITKSIQIDTGIDAAVFEWDLAGYEEVGIPSYVPKEFIPDDEDE